MSDRDPFPNEQMRDFEFENIVRELCARPAMFVHPPTFDSVCNFLNGYDARSKALLGFQEWLIVRTNGGINLTWKSLACRALSAAGDTETATSQDQLIQALGRLIDDYCRFRYEQGITKVYYDYGRWLLRHRWYQGPLRDKRAKDAKPNRATNRKRN